MFDLTGKVAYVTGAAMGNGKGSAEALAKAGAHVVLTDVSDVVFETEKAFREKGYAVSAYLVDVTKPETIRASVNDVVDKLDKIDILVNNAGIMIFAPLTDMSDEVMDTMIDVNVKGVIYTTREIFPYMVKAKYGRIVNISSITGMHVADAGANVYAMTKAAVLGFSKAMAMEGAPYGITSNSICPGSMDTPLLHRTASQISPEHPELVKDALKELVPLKSLGTGEDIGSLTVFLASDEAGYITGTQVVLDGGVTCPETSVPEVAE